VVAEAADLYRRPRKLHAGSAAALAAAANDVVVVHSKLLYDVANT
jgi:hypothetical protein